MKKVVECCDKCKRPIESAIYRCEKCRSVFCYWCCWHLRKNRYSRNGCPRCSKVQLVGD